jgi:DNA-binding MarR family transcriptional regulator
LNKWYLERVSTDATSRRRVSNAVAALAQFANSRNLDLLHASRSGVPLSLAAVAVLGRIVERSPIGLAELRKATRLRSAALSRHIRILEDGGYIERSGDPNDGRAAVVRATEKGSEDYRRVRLANDRLLGAQLVDWTSAELNELAGMMERLDADLRSVEKRAESGSEMSRGDGTAPTANGVRQAGVMED